jgi:hypothetical protein
LTARVGDEPLKILKIKSKWPSNVITPTSPTLTPLLLYPGGYCEGSGNHSGKPIRLTRRILAYRSETLSSGSRPVVSIKDSLKGILGG